MKRRASPLGLAVIVAALAACGSRSGLLGDVSDVGAFAALDAGALLGGSAALFDAASLADAGLRRELVLFGGVDPSVSPTPNPETCAGGAFADTWVWSDGAWTKRDVAGPAARTYHTMTSWGHGVLLYGGIAINESLCNTVVYTDTWLWDGADWRLLGGAGPSSDGETAVVAMAELNGAVFAYAVTDDATADTRVPTTWKWDGSSWARVDVVSPPFDLGATMATLGDRILWTGAGQTWSWDGAAWTQLGVASPTVTQGYLATLGSSLVLFGSSVLFPEAVASGTLIWNGSAWTPLEASGPTSRKDPAMAATSSEVIMFGGGDTTTTTTPLSDTWSWNGSSWTQLAVSGPPGRVLAAMATFEANVPETPTRSSLR